MYPLVAMTSGLSTPQNSAKKQKYRFLTGTRQNFFPGPPSAQILGTPMGTPGVKRNPKNSKSFYICDPAMDM